jgi:FkbM family methyltransferase
MLFTTDMGLGTGARVHLPVKVAPVYLFGDPAQAYGEEPALRLCRALLQRCPSFVDVGAHLGLYLWYLLPLLREKRVIYFEPNEELFGMLQRNLSLNGLAHAEGYCQAIGDAIGETILYVDLDDWSMSSLLRDYGQGHAHEARTVSSTTFERFATSAQICGALVKADIESLEWSLVQSISSVPHAVRFMVLEVLPNARQSGFVEAAMREMHMQGYLIRTAELTTSARAVQSNAHADKNWLFCRETPRQLADIVRPAGFSVVS